MIDPGTYTVTVAPTDPHVPADMVVDTPDLVMMTTAERNQIRSLVEAVASLTEAVAVLRTAQPADLSQLTTTVTELLTAVQELRAAQSPVSTDPTVRPNINGPVLFATATAPTVSRPGDVWVR